jgi:hypothetical protein
MVSNEKYIRLRSFLDGGALALALALDDVVPTSVLRKG